MQLMRNGKSLTYDVTGDGADTVIFVPALGATREMWRSQVAAFAPDYTVVTCDIAGHDSPSPAGYASLSEYADDLLALADRLQSRRPHVVGLSLGGMIAQAYGIRHPDRAKSLTLACTTSSYPEDQRRQTEQRATVARQQGMKPLVEPTIERWFTQDFIRSNPDAVEAVRQMLFSADPEAYAQAIQVVATMETTDRLPSIAAPVLILSAEFDAGMPPNAVSVLSSHIRDARVSVIHDAAHLCNVQQPGEFNRAVLNFVRWIDEVSPGEAGVPGLPPHGDEAPHTGPLRYIES